MTIKREQIISFQGSNGQCIIYTTALPQNGEHSGILYGADAQLFRTMTVKGFRGNIVSHSYTATLPGIGVEFSVVRDYGRLLVNGLEYNFVDKPVDSARTMTPRHLLLDDYGNRFCVVGNLHPHDHDVLQVYYSHRSMPDFLALSTLGRILHAPCMLLKIRTNLGTLHLPLPDSDLPFEFITTEGVHHQLVELPLHQYALEIEPLLGIA